MRDVVAAPDRGLTREIARNLERLQGGNTAVGVCLARTSEGMTCCTCYRDANHTGWHHCACGGEWPRSG